MTPKIQKLTYLYLRWALILYFIVFAVIILHEIIPEQYFPGILKNEVLYISLAVIIAPAFFILPGVIYNGKYKATYHGFTVDQFKYSLFLGLTLGLGPTILFFKKYDPLLKEYYKNKV